MPYVLKTVFNFIATLVINGWETYKYPQKLFISEHNGEEKMPYVLRIVFNFTATFVYGWETYKYPQK